MLLKPAIEDEILAKKTLDELLEKIKANSFPDADVVWNPLPGSQSLAISCPCHHILYEGARGPGKTVTQLMRFRSRVGIGYGAFWKGVIFDREFDNLGGLVTEAKKWFPKFFDGAVWLSSPGLYKWVWPTGEELLFRHVKRPEDYDGFHGHEYPFIGWNELTKYPDSVLYDKFMSCNRSSFDPPTNTPKNPDNGFYYTYDENGQFCTADSKPLPAIPLEVFSTTNPSGPGHTWVKMRFINVAPRGTVVRNEIEVFNPQTQSNEKVIKTQVAIFGSYRENKFLPPEYVAELERITDENLRKAWLYGSWDVTFGGMFDDLWRSNKHVVPRFVIPKGWKLDRSLDWGSSTPFSVGWYAEANGEEATIVHGGQEFRFCPPAGSIIRFFEWYGATQIGVNEGLKIGPKELANGIKLREDALINSGWISSRPYPGPADNQIGNVTDTDTDTIQKRMENEGIHWTPSDKSPGSRKIGAALAREMLQATLDKEGRAIYVMDCCPAFIELFPRQQRDEKDTDDVVKGPNDHVWDEFRYRLLKDRREIKKLQVNF